MEPFAEPAPPPGLPRPPGPDEPFTTGPHPPAFAPAVRLPAPGELTARWSQLFWIGWLLVAAAFVAVWYSSRLVGLSTWWLGPETEPRLFLVNLLPFVAPIALTIAGATHVRWLPWWGIAGALSLAGIAVFDIDRVPGFAAVEFCVAAGALLLSIASFSGMYRRVTNDETSVTQHR
jgi:hypothetical protein